MREIPFEFEVPVRFFKKAGAGKKKMRRVAGVMSTETPDRQGETLVQKGLDFSDFIANGWFNDDHKKDWGDVLGYPEFVQSFNKGDKLPDGTTAPANLTWGEGYLLNTKKAGELWDLGLALQGTGRNLGYSVEGTILKREGPNKKRVTKAKVRNVAITHAPVNTESKLGLLMKSLSTEAQIGEEEESLIRALGMGTATPGATPTGPQTGMGAGQVITPQSLERKKRPYLNLDGELEDEEEETAKKSLTDGEAVDWVLKTRPEFSLQDAGRFVETTKRLKETGRL